jgi:hypothetical protein
VTPDELVAWADGEAARLDQYWRNTHDPSKSHGSAALEFLRLNAGISSQFYEQAVDFSKWHPEGALEGIAEVLRQWATFTRLGLAAKPFALQVRVEAATDLMEQVQRLLDDGAVHPAAPIMLAGAALEEFLRGLLVGCPVAPSGKAGINSYAAALRQAELINAQDMKDITAWAGLRNHAAHGEFDAIKDVQHAQLMAAGVNLFMRQKSG